jgi:carbon storage regulator CsrA
MLVLRRKPDEEIVLTDKSGEETVITVIEIEGGGVRLGILAPDTTKILRRELIDAPKQGAEG